ncbi:hypothetical protein SAMN04488583_6370 [Mycobacterium sp. 88mf]|nr:hypothetical protein SAMN04488583_6370 [Mycobacterium sp. 88mf]SFG61412.1 hypothetical protein SAMN04488582_11071 [Mycobacterium sp. 455mf]
MELDQKPTISDYRDDDMIPARLMPTLFPDTNKQTWNIMRHKGTGPIYTKIARRVYYRRRDIEAWLERNRMVRTDLPAS